MNLFLKISGVIFWLIAVLFCIYFIYMAFGMPLIWALRIVRAQEKIIKRTCKYRYDTLVHYWKLAVIEDMRGYMWIGDIKVIYPGSEQLYKDDK